MNTLKVFLIGNPNFSIQPKRSYLIDQYTFLYSNYKIEFIRLNKNILNLYNLLLNKSDLILICIHSTPNRKNKNNSLRLINELHNKLNKRILLWSCEIDSDNQIVFFKNIFNPYLVLFSYQNEYTVFDGCINSNQITWFQYLFYCFKIIN